MASPSAVCSKEYRGVDRALDTTTKSVSSVWIEGLRKLAHKTDGMHKKQKIFERKSLGANFMWPSRDNLNQAPGRMFR
jgi:hypothetical protein